MFGSATGKISILSSKSCTLISRLAPGTSYGYTGGKYVLNTSANNLNSCLSPTYILLWIADITLEPRSRRATVVPTAACWFISPTCISAMAANLWPAETTTPINCKRVWSGPSYKVYWSSWPSLAIPSSSNFLSCNWFSVTGGDPNSTSL